MAKTGPKELWMADKTPIVYGLWITRSILRQRAGIQNGLIDAALECWNVWRHQMAKMGRPKIEIKWDTVDKLLHIQCTGEEIESVLNCSYDTLERAFPSCSQTPNIKRLG